MPEVVIARIERILDAQRTALVSHDLTAIAATNLDLADALATLRASPADRSPAARRLRLALRAHGELITRAHAANHRALNALVLPATTYGGTAPAPSTGTYLVA